MGSSLSGLDPLVALVPDASGVAALAVASEPLALGVAATSAGAAARGDGAGAGAGPASAPPIVPRNDCALCRALPTSFSTRWRTIGTPKVTATWPMLRAVVV